MDATNCSPEQLVNFIVIDSLADTASAVKEPDSEETGDSTDTNQDNDAPPEDAPSKEKAD